MQIEKLRSLIKESINEYIKEIDDAAEKAANEARISKCEEAIALRQERLARVEENEDLKELADGNKIKEIQNEIKMLERAKKKFEAKKAKMEKASDKKEDKEDKVVTDAKEDSAPVDEADVMEKMNVTDGLELEEGIGENDFIYKDKTGKTKYVTADSIEQAKEKVAKFGADPKTVTAKKSVNESFLKMQKLAGVITEAEYNKKKRLIENQLEEISLSGALSKIKDKITNSSIFNKLIDTIVSKMSEKDKENFKTKFALSEAEGGPSLEDILSKVDAENPDKNVKKPEELKEELDKDTFEGKIVNLVRNVTGLNLLALGGVPLGILINTILGLSTWGMGAFVGPVISLVASLIIHGISRKLLGLKGNDPMIGS